MLSVEAVIAVPEEEHDDDTDVEYAACFDDVEHNVGGLCTIEWYASDFCPEVQPARSKFAPHGLIRLVMDNVALDDDDDGLDDDGLDNDALGSFAFLLEEPPRDTHSVAKAKLLAPPPMLLAKPRTPPPPPKPAFPTMADVDEPESPLCRCLPMLLIHLYYLLLGEKICWSRFRELMLKMKMQFRFVALSSLRLSLKRCQSAF